MINPQQPIPEEFPTADPDPLRNWIRIPINPVPEQALRNLLEAATQDSGGGQAARCFLFWMAGAKKPSGFEGQGGLELRRMDGSLRQSAVEVMQWWIGPTESDEPLYLVLRQLAEHFSSGQ